MGHGQKVARKYLNGKFYFSHIAALFVSGGLDFCCYTELKLNPRCQSYQLWQEKA